jgi:hypothetical protein
LKKKLNTSIRGIMMFFVVFCLVIVTVAALPLILATPTHETTKYQNSQWSTTCVADRIQVDNDMKYLTTAAKNYDTTSLSTYASTLCTDSQKAIDDSDLYNVSPDLQDTKNEYRLAMLQANKVAVYANSGLEGYNNGNFEAVNSELKKATECIESYNQHIKKAAEIKHHHSGEQHKGRKHSGEQYKSEKHSSEQYQNGQYPGVLFTGEQYLGEQFPGGQFPDEQF